MHDATGFRPHARPLRRLWKPVLAAGICGAVAFFGREELLPFSEAVLGFLVFLVLAAVFFAFDSMLFRARRIPPQDLPPSSKTERT